MLGKLLKYEFKYLIKNFIRVYVIYGVLLMAVILLFHIGNADTSNSTGFFGILFSACFTAYAFFTVFLIFITIGNNVRRFKRNMFSQEGYLTNTLPVTPEQHIVAKVIAGGASCIASYIVIFFGIWLLLVGFGLGSEVASLFSSLIQYMEFRYVIPTFLSSTTGFLALLLCCYLAVSFSSMIGGSKAKSAALVIGGIIAYMVITSMITSSIETDLYSALRRGDYADAVYRATVTRMYILTLIHTAIAAGEFFAIVHIIKTKLNLQ